MNGVKHNKTEPAVSKTRDTEDYLFTDKSETNAKKETVPYRKGVDFLSYNYGENFMASSSKKTDPSPNDEPNDASHVSLVEQESVDFGNEEPSSNDQFDDSQNWDEIAQHEADKHEVSKGLLYYLIPATFIIAALSWTGFFIYSNLSTIEVGIAITDVSTLIINWATPTILIVLGWLLFMRSSKAEAMRFGDVSNSLHNEAQNVQNKIREVNEDIALARDFLSQYSKDLEHIGHNTSTNIINAADTIETSLSQAIDKADTLEKVSGATNKNLELLRKNLPVVNSAAKDATNMIGKAGMEAIDQVRSLKTILNENAKASQANKNELAALSEKNQSLASEIQAQSADVQSFSEAMVEKSQQEIQAISETIKNEYQKFDDAVSATSQNLEKQSQDITSNLKNNIEQLSAALQDLGKNNTQEDQHISDMVFKIQQHIEKSDEHLAVLSDKASDQTAKMAFAMTALKDNSDSVTEGLSNNCSQAELLIERSEKLLLALDSSSREMDETMPASAQRLDDIFTSLDERFVSTFENINKLSDHSEAMSNKYKEINDMLSNSADQIQNLLQSQSNDMNMNSDKVDQILNTLQESKTVIEDITANAGEAFTEQVNVVNQKISESVEFSRTELNKNIDFTSQKIADNGTNIIQDTIDKQVSAIETSLQTSLDVHVKSASEAVSKLQTQLAVIDQMTDSIEKRIQDSAEEFSSVGDESFSRQMALLTESLNSTAIDVTKILSNDVTDNAWASYLKGDRGVFTRRAVKLLSANDAKLILNYYDENMEFRDHVNRYIHDFEAMMRVLLSTRDGNSIGVTVLSSDVGKLYVALAQAIERLRH